jgi:hypothetical protein
MEGIDPAAVRQNGIESTPVEGAEPGPGDLPTEALAAAPASDRLSASHRVAVPADTMVSERRTVRMGAVPPPTGRLDPLVDPVPVAPGPRPWLWGAGPGPMLAIIAAGVVVLAILVFLIARAGQPDRAPVATVIPPAAAPDTTTPAPALTAPTQAPAAQPPVAAAPAAPAAQPPVAAAPAAPAAQPSVAAAPAAPAAQPPVAAAPPVAPAAQPPVAAQPTQGSDAAALPIVAPIPTLTPFPSSTGANTSPGTTLQVGQAWRQNGLSLGLAAAQASANGVSMNFLLTNTSSSQVAQKFSRNQVFSATDNSNARLTLVDPNYSYNLSLPPNSTAIFDSAHDGGAISFSGNLGDPRITSITVTVSGLGGITSARWTIPIQR